MATSNKFLDLEGVKRLLSKINTLLDTKIDKVEGKGLSTNDYTTDEKTKLANIHEEATKTTVTAVAQGTVATNGTGSVKIADISVNGTETEIYAPTYTLPTASDAVLGGVKVDDSTIGIADGVISIKAITTDKVTGLDTTLEELDARITGLSEDTYTTGDIDDMVDELKQNISAIPKFDIKVVSKLPTTDISKSTIYLVKSAKTSQDNLYTEYIYITDEEDNSKWEKLGEQTLDLSGYSTTEEVQVMISDVTDTKITGLATATEDNVVVFGADGYTVKDSGFSIATSVPANAQFTDSKVNVSSSTAKNYLMGTAASPTDTATGTTAVANTAVYVTDGTLTATNFVGDGSALTNLNINAISNDEIDALFT